MTFYSGEIINHNLISFSIWCEKLKKRFQCYEKTDFEILPTKDVIFEITPHDKTFLATSVQARPVCYMMVGVQGSGKSTYIQRNLSEYPLISTDSYIERMSKHTGLTYTELWSSYFDDARKYMHLKLNHLISKKKSFVWDQMNLTIQTRRKNLIKIPDYYLKYAIVMKTPERSEHITRLNSRVGKYIPIVHVDNAIRDLQYPKIEEGFDRIITND